MHSVEVKAQSDPRNRQFTSTGTVSQTEDVKLVRGECRCEQMGRSGPARGGDTSPADRDGVFRLENSTDGVS